jgi:hypothetical protein
MAGFVATDPLVPKGGIARENLPKWVPAIARLICDEEGM